MKISSEWVREFIDLPADDHQLAEALTMHGIAVEGIAPVDGHAVYEVEFTTNRPDAMNHYGVARECSAIYDAALKPLTVKLPPAASAPEPPFPIEIEDALGCARYTAQVIRGVKVGTTPRNLVKRLESVEQRSINNIADASNYVLWEMGHPTHAFDLDLLEGGKIIVRRARSGETLKTLDGVERKLTRDDLVIADATKPVALAGVMGGFNSMITAGTRNVLIESAWFDPTTIRKTAKRHGMHTDASHRFERGADFGATSLACSRVVQLILESAGGQLEGGEIDAVARRVGGTAITLRCGEIKRILGKEIPAPEIERIMCRLGFTVLSGPTSAAAVFSLQAPSWRLDIVREIDVIEEIARLYGYDNFPNTLPAFSGAVIACADEQKDARLRRTLLALGYDEAMSWTFIGAQDAPAFSSSEAPLLENPISDEAAVMRTSLLPGMLQMLAWNLNRGNNDVRLFEAGHVFAKIGEKVDERKRLSLGATGAAEPASWDRPSRVYSFFDMKGDVEELLSAFSCRGLYFDGHTAGFLHPGRSARAVLNGAMVAQFGQLHPRLAAARKLRQDVFVGEIYLDRLYEHNLREARYTPIPRFPAVDRDFSFVFDNAVSFEAITKAVAALKLGELCQFVPAEIFRGGAIPAGKYSVLLRAEFQSPERTLTDEEVAVWAQSIVQTLQKLGGVLRA